MKAAVAVPDVDEAVDHCSVDVLPESGFVTDQDAPLSTQTVVGDVVKVSAVAEPYLCPVKVGAE